MATDLQAAIMCKLGPIRQTEISMKSFIRLAAAMGVCSLALCGSASAATLNFTNYIDTVANEHAVISDFVLNGFSVAAHGSVTTAGGNVPGGFVDYLSSPQAYFDKGSAGIGVCRVTSGDVGDGANGTGSCTPAGDDNVTGFSTPNVTQTGVEILSTSFTVVGALTDAVLVSNLIFRNEGHVLSFGSGKYIDISLTGLAGSWISYLLSTTGNGFLAAPPASWSLAAGQFMHFRYNNQQFYLSSASVLRDPGGGTGEVPIPAALPLLAGALGGLGMLGRWRKRRQNTSAVAA